MCNLVRWAWLFTSTQKHRLHFNIFQCCSESNYSFLKLRQRFVLIAINLENDYALEINGKNLKKKIIAGADKTGRSCLIASQIRLKTFFIEKASF